MTSFESTVELLRLAKTGHGDYLNQVLERYRPRLLERIRLMMGQKARRAAESGDFLQDVLVRIVTNLDGFEMRDERPSCAGRCGSPAIASPTWSGARGSGPSRA
jgi:hypothetical protein